MDEIELARKAASGDLSAWHEFLNQYFPYIKSIIARFTKDDELISDLSISLIEKLRSRKLSRFSGRSSLKTWLFVVTLNHCRDFFRSKKGINHIKSITSNLSRIEKRFFELYYMEGLSIKDVYESMKLEVGEELSYIDLLNMEDRIRSVAKEKRLQKIIETLLKQRKVRIETDRGSEYNEQMLYGYGPFGTPQELSLEKEELIKALEYLKKAISMLPYRDQIVLKLRFEHRVSARKICEIMDLSNEKQVYRCVDKLLGRLKELMLESGISEEKFVEIASSIEELISHPGE